MARSRRAAWVAVLLSTVGAACDPAPTAPTTDGGDAAAPDDAAAAADLGDGGPAAGDGAVPGGALTRLAGPIGGPGDWDGAGASARFSAPRGLAVDGAGHLFVADRGNHTLRRIDLASGAVTTVAGVSRAAGTADGAGAAARFTAPSGLAFVGGKLYVADSGSYTIRRFDPATGAVTTLAGAAGQEGTADGTTAGRLGMVAGMTTDGATRLFVTGYSNTVRQIDLATGEITTLAGQPDVFGSADGVGANATFRLPVDVAYAAGHLYVADGNNCTVRDLDLASNAVTTLAGQASACDAVDAAGAMARFSSPSGIAADGAGVLYVAESGAKGHTLRKVVITTGAVSTVAGMAGVAGTVDAVGAAARLSSPAGLLVDGAGHLLFTSYDHSVRQLDLAGAAVTTLAGQPEAQRGTVDGVGAAARFVRPLGMASDGTGAIFVADMLAHVIRRVELATGRVSTLAGGGSMPGFADGVGEAARFYSPRAVAYAAGKLYVADIYNASIRQIDVATRAVTTFAGMAGAAGDADGTGAAARFSLPAAVATDGAGSLYVADRNNHVVRKVVLATAEVTTIAGGKGQPGAADGALAEARFHYPEGIVCVGTDELYVTDQLGAVVRRVRLGAGQVSTVAGAVSDSAYADGPGASARFKGIAGSATWNGASALYLADDGASAVRTLSLATGEVSTAVGTPAGYGVRLGALPAALSCPSGVLALPGARLVIADRCDRALLLAR